jgi:threonine dehydrogenase-like Zn-dependent dehydrogenase
MRVAEELGAEPIFVDKQDLAAFDFGRRGATRVLVVAPPSELLVAAKVAARGAIISYIGIAWDKKGVIALDADAFHFKRQQLRASMASPGTRAAEALELLASGAFDPRKVLSGTFTLPEIGAAMVQNRDDKANAIKMVMVNQACAWNT